MNAKDPTKMSREKPSEAAIAAAAQRIWEDEGRPEGKAEEHWTRAEEQLRKKLPGDEEEQVRI